MELTTLCYLEKDDKYLMLHRIKEKEDINSGKWLGVGGHFEKYESPEECVIREVKEETGLDMISYKLRGVITFVLGEFWEYMFLYTSDEFRGDLIECDEGKLKWIDKKDILKLNMWEGDKIFLKLIKENREFFSMKMVYEKDKVIEVIIDGKKVEDLDELLER